MGTRKLGLDVTLGRDPQQDALPAPGEERGADLAACLVPGHMLRGRYVLDRLIGHGGMGQVWRAKDLLGEEAHDRHPFVAVKVLTGDYATDPEAFVALHREAVRAQKLAHPNILTVFTFDRDESTGQAFIAMELLQGAPLDRVIQEAGEAGVPPRQAIPIIRGMAEGLAHAHRSGIVHSDFKPANVFLTQEGVPKLLDFGMARAIRAADRITLTMAALDDSGFRGCTPAYASTELLANSGEPVPSDDVFAFGMVVCELLTGRHAFQGCTAPEARRQGLKPPPLRGLPPHMTRAIQRALSFDRADRQADAEVLLREMQGMPLLRRVLIGACALLLNAGGWAYHSHLQSLPAEPLEKLPQAAQQQFLRKIELGNEALAYLAGSQGITAADDAARHLLGCLPPASQGRPRCGGTAQGRGSGAATVQPGTGQDPRPGGVAEVPGAQ